MLPPPRFEPQSLPPDLWYWLFGTLALIAFQKYVTRHTASQAIEADSAHYTVDVATNLSIIVTLVVVKFLGWSWFDTLTAFAVSAYLLYNAYKLARDAVGLLTDRELDDEIRLNIKKIVLGHDFTHGIHDLRTRDLGGTATTRDVTDTLLELLP